MYPRTSSLCRLAVVGITLGLVTRAGAQLASKSPFMPPQNAASNAPTAGAPLEFRGFIETSEGVQYRIYDPAKKTYTWVKLNQRDPDFDVVAKQHDEGQKTLTIEHQGRPLTLAMRDSKVVSSGSAGQAMPPPPQLMMNANVPPAVTQAVVLNPTPADEQRRLEAVAAEVARRRALREQATQQINQGSPPQVAIPQPPVQAQGQPQRNYQQQGGQNPNTRGPGPTNRQR